MTVCRVDILDEGGVLACLTGDDADLDDALLAMLQAEQEKDDGWWWWEGDYPTRIQATSVRSGELQVGKFRKQPCICGHGHSWDVWPVDEDEFPRGSFWGVLG